jgi:phosphoesterase RecJ-like protein
LAIDLLEPQFATFTLSASTAFEPLPASELVAFASCTDDVRDFHQAMATARSLFITAHVGPDGDTLGSMLGVKHAFLKKYPQLERIDAVIAGKMPDIYRFLPGVDGVLNVDVDAQLAADQFLPQYDVAISVDCGSLDRLGPSRPWFEGARLSVNIDHHISNKCFGKSNIVLPKASASGEVVADLLDVFGIALDANIATCLYAALLTDTGGFKYAAATPKAFRLAGVLAEAGANPEFIYKEIYETRPRSQVTLHARALLEAQYNDAQTVGWAVVTRQMLKDTTCLDEHVEGIVEAIRQIDTVKIAAIFKETKEGDTKVSLRSDDHRINVASLLEPLNGGGHPMAAGATLVMDVQAGQKLLIPLLNEAVAACG